MVEEMPVGDWRLSVYRQIWIDRVAQVVVSTASEVRNLHERPHTADRSIDKYGGWVGRPYTTRFIAYGNLKIQSGNGATSGVRLVVLSDARTLPARHFDDGSTGEAFAAVILCGGPGAGGTMRGPLLVRVLARILAQKRAAVCSW